ncbi:MAG: GlsB/YeaQ/YmgE family stress response membrane protein [Xanthomonadaceae bacterium]|nr:GlsB/YeaQ/YmgE family stress response membrane protein [Xanthomonadaceae bacterium]
MTIESILGVLIIGGLAGWIAGLLVRGRGQGIIMNIIVGIIGALLGSWIFGFFGITSGGLIGNLITAIVGAAVLLGLLQLIKK